MRKLLLLVLLMAVSFLSVPVRAVEALGEADELTLSISLDKPVHFSDVEGDAVLVPAGTYWVFPEGDNLMLVAVEAADIYTLVATAEESGEENPYPTAASVPNEEGEPDIHYVVFTSTTGKQLVAEGSYSGVKPRGFLGDKAKDAAAAARRRAQQNARLQALKRKALENERLMQAAQQAQALIEQARSLGQKQAMERAQFLVRDIAITLKDYGEDAARKKLRTYSPELAVLIPIAVPKGEMLGLTKQAAIFVNRNRSLIGEMLRRSANSPTIRNHISERRGINFSSAEVKQIAVDIIGQGDNALQMPFVGTRGAGDLYKGDFRGPSLSVGVNVAGSLGIGGVLSGGGAISFTRIANGEVTFSPDVCIWGGGGLTVGPKAEVDVSVGVAVWQGAASDIGWTPSLDLSDEDLNAVIRGYGVPLDIGFTAYGGGSVTVFFGFGTAGAIHPTILGFGVAAAAGAGGGGSLGLVYTYVGCPVRGS